MEAINNDFAGALIDELIDSEDENRNSSREVPVFDLRKEMNKRS